MSRVDPDSTPGWRSSSSSVRWGRKRRGIVRSGIPESSTGIAVIAMFSSSSSKRPPRGVADELDSFGERIDFVRRPVAAGEADDVGVLGGDGQHSVAVARDQDRHIGQVLVHVLDDVLHVVDPLPSARVRQLGCLELLTHISRAQPELESPVGEIAHGADVPGQQRGLVETGVEDEGADAQRARGRRHRRQRRKRGGRPEVIGHVQHVVAQVLGAARPVLDRATVTARPADRDRTGNP